MRDYARFLGNWEKPRPSLVAEFEAREVLLTTDYAVFLMEEYQAELSNVRLVVELERSSALSRFVDAKVEDRIKADKENKPMMAQEAKLQLNSRLPKLQIEIFSMTRICLFSAMVRKFCTIT